jgi:hypothetical protein
MDAFTVIASGQIEEGSEKREHVQPLNLFMRRPIGGLSPETMTQLPDSESFRTHHGHWQMRMRWVGSETAPDAAVLPEADRTRSCYRQDDGVAGRTARCRWAE